LEHEDLTPRELAVKYTDENKYFFGIISLPDPEGGRPDHGAGAYCYEGRQ
jgi:hypothetical protein